MYYSIGFFVEQHTQSSSRIMRHHVVIIVLREPRLKLPLNFKERRDHENSGASQ